MSEFEQNWPISEDLRDHSRYVNYGVDEINNRLMLPADRRWDIAYGALTMGDPKASVLAEGEPGTGKTQFGNIVFGQESRTDIASTDTPETLEGFPNPIKKGEFIPGKMPLNEDDFRLFLNEISHLRDTGPLHKYWDGTELSVNGKRYPLDSAPIYATTNFANGGRAKKLDEALRSRMGITLLSGDDASSVARIVQGHDIGATRLSEDSGLLPPPKARMQIRAGLEKTHRLSKDAGEFMASTLENMNKTGLFEDVNASDARIGQGWQQAVRAMRLIDGGAASEAPIKPEDLVYVAPLALGSVALLNTRGGAKFQQEMGRMDALKPLEKAIIARRMVAAVALKTYLDYKTLESVSEEKMIKHLDRFSYANSADADVINEVAIQSLLGNDSGQQEIQNEKKSGRFFGRRSSR